MRAVSAYQTTDVTLTTTLEIKVADFPPVTAQFPGQRCTLQAILNFFTGAGTTAVTARIRRGTTVSGPLVGEAVNLNIGAAVNGVISIAVDIELGDVLNEPYLVSLQQAGATGNGVALNAALMEVLYP
jgi:hypothetical protein